MTTEWNGRSVEIVWCSETWIGGFGLFQEYGCYAPKFNGWFVFKLLNGEVWSIAPKGRFDLTRSATVEEKRWIKKLLQKKS